MEHPSSQKSIITLGPWLDSAAGRYVRAWEQSRLDQLTADIFGFNAMQIGLPQIHALQASRMPHRWVCDVVGLPTAASMPALAGQATHAAIIDPLAGAMPGHAASTGAATAATATTATTIEAVAGTGPAATAPVSVLLDFAELPFASQSLDLIVLPHVLEFAPEPHQVLREVERVLIPEGQLIVCGFNPASLWGARQAGGRIGGGHFLPPDGEFISLPRMKDWLKLLNMEVNRGHFGCYAPPCTTETWLGRYAFMEKAGPRWWPYFGAVYMLQAIKRVKGMRLIGPAWKRRPVATPHAVPVTSRSNREHTVKQD